MCEEERYLICANLKSESLSRCPFYSCTVLVLQAKPLFQLALADFLASIALIGSTIINFLSYETAHKSGVVCNDGLSLSLMFFCISFLLVIIYACESAYTAQGWRVQTEEACRFIPLIGYIIYIRTITLTQVPYIPSSPGSNDVRNYDSGSTNAKFCNSCILFLHLHIENDSCPAVDLRHRNITRGFIFASVLGVLICCTLVYWRLQSWYRHYEQAGMFQVSTRHAGTICSSARYMILVIIFCWTPPLVVICLSFACSETDRMFPLFVMQAMSISLQGFLNSIVYAWRRRNFREAVLGERLPLLSYTNQAFFDQSLSET
uniref:Si:dkey-30c15.2 n=1 Tax=Electrophorus electricus TaxID=8005 RepID=A0A4W4EQT6_ELEEL